MTTVDGPSQHHSHDAGLDTQGLIKKVVGSVFAVVKGEKKVAIEKKLRLFEYVIVWSFIQKSDDKEDKERLEILVPPKLVVARDDKEVLMLASKDIPEKYDLSEVEVVIRPF